MNLCECFTLISMTILLHPCLKQPFMWRKTSVIDIILSKKIIYGYGPPNIFPLYVIENIVLLEIAYQDYVNRVGSILENNKKSMWPSFPLIFDSYVIEFSREMEKEVPSLKNIHFGNKLFKRQDPELVLYIHFQLLNFVSYTHESNAE